MLYVYIGSAAAGGILIAFLTIMFVKMRKSRSNHSGLPANLTFQNEDDFIQSQGIAVPYGSNQLDNVTTSSSFYSDHHRRPDVVQSTIYPGSKASASSITEGYPNESGQIFSNPTNNSWLTPPGEWQGSFSDWHGSSSERQDLYIHRPNSFSLRDQGSRQSRHKNAKMLTSTSFSLAEDGSRRRYAPNPAHFSQFGPSLPAVCDIRIQ